MSVLNFPIIIDYFNFSLVLRLKNGEEIQNSAPFPIMESNKDLSSEFEFLLDDLDDVFKTLTLVKYGKLEICFNHGDEIISYFNLIKQKFDRFIVAAGGIVFVEKEPNKILSIIRNGKFDLPKGKVENNESIEEAAVREVMEETGIKDIRLLKNIYESYHVYFINGQSILKKTYWFSMTTNVGNILKPQFEEGIEKVFWYSLDEPSQQISTFSNINRIISAYKQQFKTQNNDYYVRIVRMVFRSDEIQNFEQIFHNSEPKIKKFPNCFGVRLFQDASDPRVFYTYSLWKEPEDLERYRQSELFKDTWSKTKPLFEEKPMAFTLKQAISKLDS